MCVCVCGWGGGSDDDLKREALFLYCGPAFWGSADAHFKGEPKRRKHLKGTEEKNVFKGDGSQETI